MSQFKITKKILVGFITLVLVLSIFAGGTQRSHAQIGAVARGSFDTALYCSGLLDKLGGFLSGLLGGFLSAGEVPVKEEQERNQQGCLDHIAFVAANLLIENAVRDTINWANGRSGEGGPKYVRDFRGYMGQIADDFIGEAILGSPLGFVCDPFRVQIRASLARAYIPQERVQCTLAEVTSNVRNFVRGDFFDGGWDAWGELVTRSNPYTQFLHARSSLALELKARQSMELEELRWGGGFMSWKTCPGERYQCRCGGSAMDLLVETGSQEGFRNERFCVEGPPELDASSVFLPSYSSDAAGCAEHGGIHECALPENINTPGSLIENQVNNVLSSGQRRLEVADEFNEIVSALLNKLISDIFLPSGLSEYVPRAGSEAILENNPTGNDLCQTYGICDPLSPDFRYQLCAKDCEQRYCTEESREENGGENNQEQYTEGNLVCEDIQHDACVDQCAIDFPPDGSIPGTGSGMCTDCICEGQPDETKNHRSVVEDAITATLEDHPDYQLALNNDENRFAFIEEVVATINEESEFDWFGAVIPLNANDNPTSGDLIAIWRNGDEFMERYDILASKDKESTIGDAKQAGYTGDIYLQCHPEGNRAGLTPPLSDNGGSGTTYGNDSGAPDSIELVDVRWIDNSDVGDWDETSKLRVKILSEGSQIDLEYDKKNVWPQKTQINGRVVVGNAWIVVWRGGEWVAGTFEWMGPGQTKKDTKNFVTHSAEIADNNNKLDNFQPQSGETYGFVVSTLVRLGKKSRDSQDNWVRERTNIFTVVWP